jgi:hypothetical protein
MGLFGLGKKRGPDVIDLTKDYNKKKNSPDSDEIVADPLSGSNTSATSSGFDFLSSLAGGASTNSSNSEDSNSSQSNVVDLSSNSISSDSSNSDPISRKSRLAKRLMDMTEKLEDINNQIYHLQQRIDVLEKKSGV